MNTAKKLLVCGLLVVSLTCVAGGCVAYAIYESLSSTIQPISGAVDIGSEWIEIVPPEPLKAMQVRQEIYLEIPGVTTWSVEDGKTVKYEDGRSGKIEGTLHDDQGQSYELAISGKSGGLYLSRKLPPVTYDSPPLATRFPRDRSYSKLRVRSEVPVNSSKIEWVCSTPK